jgi:hypothetical protein
MRAVCAAHRADAATRPIDRATDRDINHGRVWIIARGAGASRDANANDANDACGIIVASNCHVEFPRAIERATAMGTRDEAMGTVIGA